MRRCSLEDAVRRKAWAEALALIAAELRRPDLELQARALKAEHLAAGGLTLGISLRRRALACELLEMGLAELTPQAQDVLRLRAYDTFPNVWRRGHSRSTIGA